MSLIRSHDIVLYGAECGIVLKPLADVHLPLLYRWCADAEVMKWADEDGTCCDAQTVRTMYGHLSRTGHCFLMEADGVPVGECSLAKANDAHLREMYPSGVDVRRIDILIGEKKQWGRGIGTAAVKLLVKFAFEQEYADVLHCVCREDNVRSCRLWEKAGFSLIDREAMSANGKRTYCCHYRLRRWEYS